MKYTGFLLLFLMMISFSVQAEASQIIMETQSDYYTARSFYSGPISTVVLFGGTTSSEEFGVRVSVTYASNGTGKKPRKKESFLFRPVDGTIMKKEKQLVWIKGDGTEIPVAKKGFMSWNALDNVELKYQIDEKFDKLIVKGWAEISSDK